MAGRWLVSYEESQEGCLASVYTVPGCHVEGRTREEARSRVLEALRLYFDEVDPNEIQDATPGLREHLVPLLTDEAKDGIKRVGNLIRAKPKAG